MRIALKKNFLLVGLLWITLIEIFLGGGGRLVDVGAVSIRMYLFAFGLVVGLIVVVARGEMNKALTLLGLFYTILLLVGIVAGFINNPMPGTVMADVKPLLFFYSFIFFSAAIAKEEDMQMVIRLLKVCAVILAIGYLIIFALINTKSIPFDPFYVWASLTEEFYFRGEFAFFYKGFVFMCAGLFFFQWRRSFRDKMAIMLICTAVVLTFTRGFVICILLVYIFNLIFIRKRFITFLLIIIVIVLTAIPVYEFISSSDQVDRASSNSSRIDQLKAVADVGFHPIDIILGRGFGIMNVNDRHTLHIEISYIEIFLKQGIVGLSFWIFALYVVFEGYRKAARNGNERTARSFLLACIFVYLLSFTNPFLNNPMGMTVIIISLLSFKIMSAKEEKEISPAV